MSSQAKVDIDCLRVVVSLYAVCMLVTYAVSLWVGSPFGLWFTDGYLVIVLALVTLIFFGVVWDGSLILLGIAGEKWPWPPKAGGRLISVEGVRRFRFFSCGSTPMILIVLTAFVILGTSNITLISLKLIGHVTEWRDPYLWSVERETIGWLTSLPINVSAWDRLYHGCWPIEFFAAFVLVVLGRGTRLILHYSVSLILLFYIGRFLGVINPVMGPAFFKPELYGYLDHSVTQQAMHFVSIVMAQPAEKAIEHGAILLGGVSAMPSLHVAMVTVTSYWLAVAKRWTMFFTVPWVLSVWTATVVLGWHYILDGAGGILLGAGCIGLTYGLLKRLNREKLLRKL